MAAKRTPPKAAKPTAPAKATMAPAKAPAVAPVASAPTPKVILWPAPLTAFLALAKAQGSASCECLDGAKVTVVCAEGQTTLRLEEAPTGFPCYDYQPDCFGEPESLPKLLSRIGEAHGALVLPQA